MQQGVHASSRRALLQLRWKKPPSGGMRVQAKPNAAPPIVWSCCHERIVCRDQRLPPKETR